MTYRSVSVIPSGRNRDERPELRDLNKHVVEQYAPIWESLGLKLGLEYYRIAIISANNRHDVEACCREMLCKWLEIDVSASWGKLDDALRTPRATVRLVSHDDTGEEPIDIVTEGYETMHQRRKRRLNKALKDNRKEELCLYKLVIFGPSRVGKTSLFQVLLNKTPSKKSKSTGVYKFQMFKVAVSKADSKFSWREVKIEDEISWLRYLLDKIEEDSKQVKQPELPRSDSINRADSLDASKILCESNDESVEEFETLMACYDSGGQPEFFDVMPLLATNLTGYIMVLDMSKDLNDPIESTANIDGKEYPSADKISSLVMMKNAIASIQSCSGNASCNNLLVVGTYLDKCDDPKEQVTRLDEQVQIELVENKAESLFRKCQRHNVTQAIDTTYIHPVANFIESEAIKNNINIKQVTDDSVQRVYTAVENMSKTNTLHEEIPVNSLLFLFEIQLKLNDPPFYVKKIKYSEYAEKCRIDRKKVDKELEYFHKLGFIFFFKKDIEDVVFSPQWVFNRLSDIIFRKYKPKDNSQKKDFDKGQITKDTFQTIFSDEPYGEGKVYEIQDEDICYLQKIFISQSIMAKFPDRNNVYFMPALLNKGSPDDKSLQEKIKEKFGKRIYEKMIVKFKNHYFPRVIFCYLATKLMEERWKIQSEPRYNNVLIFEIQIDQYVALFDYSTEIAIEMYSKNKGESDLAMKPYEICKLVYQFITTCCEIIQVDNSFEFGFTCIKFDDCKQFAGVKRQYPYEAEKHCEDGEHTQRLKRDELVWLFPPNIMNEKEQLQQTTQNDVGIPGISKLSIEVDYHRLLWQELNKIFGDDIFVMAVGQKLSFCDYDVTAGHAELAAQKSFELVNHTIACATNYSSKGSLVSQMWDTLLLEKGPKAGPDEQSAFREAKEALFVDYDKNLPTDMYQGYFDKEIALKQKKLEIERESIKNYGDQWKVNFDKSLKASKEYLEFEHVAKVVEPHLDAIEVWKHGPLFHHLNHLKQVLKENTKYVDDFTGSSLKYYRVSLQPSNWYQWLQVGSFHEDGAWMEINVDSKNDDHDQATLYRNLGGSVKRYYNLNKHSDVKITFKVRAVQISRPWFDLSVLRNKNYKISGVNPGSWSTGKLEADNDGSFPLLSTQMIMARDIKVTASTEMEHGVITDACSLFGVGGDYCKRINNNSIELKGTQVIGYACTLVPKFPH